MSTNRLAVVFGGGTVQWFANHLALCTPHRGNTARKLYDKIEQDWPEMDPVLCMTKYAIDSTDHEKNLFTEFDVESNEDLQRVVDQYVNNSLTKVIFFSSAVLDYHASFDDLPLDQQHKYGKRFSTREQPELDLKLKTCDKIIKTIRSKRKDVFLVGFKQTSGATEDEQYIAGLGLCKESSCNLVLANDSVTRTNMIITPEEARYHVTKDRDEALASLLHMTKLRSHLTFTRSTVVSGEPVPWSSPEVPESLRKVVDHCIAEGAYKPFNGSTVGHFAVKLNDTTFLTSQRKTNFNDLSDIGLVKIETDGPDTVIAYGSKPSVGGQSQRIVFNEHPEMDCIAHFHCPIREGSEVPQVSQYEYECGSHQCGDNTSKNLKQFGNLKAVYLQEHGPNIVFNRNIDPQEVIDFIEANFDLSKKTGGLVSL